MKFLQIFDGKLVYSGIHMIYSEPSVVYSLIFGMN